MMSGALRFVGAFALAVFVGCATPIVGGECREGHTPCDGICVNLQTDRDNCGACGNACAAAESCVMGICVFDDGGLIDGGDGGDGGGVDGGDGGGVDGGDGGDGGGVDGGDGGGVDGGDGCRCAPGETCCDDVCVDTDSDPNHCGSCGVMCLAGEYCAAGVCAEDCAPPLMRCGGLCLDVSDDPDNCGSCGHVCDSGICIDGMCSDGIAGHVVVIGHDYQRSRAGQNRLAGNAVILLANTRSDEPIEVIAFEGDALSASIAGVDRAINQVATARGRSWVRTSATASEMTGLLDTAHVVVIYHQSASSDAHLASLASLWGTAFITYLERGGVIVLFEGASTHSGTHQVLAAAGLIGMSSVSAIDGASVGVVRPGDVVALGVPTSYRAELSSVALPTADGSAAVASHMSGPVVLHWVF